MSGANRNHGSDLIAARLGELRAAVPANPGGRPAKNSEHDVQSFGKATADEQAGITHTTGKRCEAVATSERLQNYSHANNLPASWGTIHELSPLEIGMHALHCVDLSSGGRGKKGGLSAYAAAVGRKHNTVSQLVQAARVAEKVSVDRQVLQDKTQHLSAIHALPESCWQAAVEANRARAEAAQAGNVGRAAAKKKHAEFSSGPNGPTTKKPANPAPEQPAPKQHKSRQAKAKRASEGEQRGEIPHVDETTDTLGRQQPARKPVRTAYVDPTPATWKNLPRQWVRNFRTTTRPTGHNREVTT